jgi:hypothetical protein
VLTEGDQSSILFNNDSIDNDNDNAPLSPRRPQSESYGFEGITGILALSRIDKEATEELRRRAEALYLLRHSSELATTHSGSKLPPRFQSFYPHKATDVEILETNKYKSYYLAREFYGAGHGDVHHTHSGAASKSDERHTKFIDNPFTLFTIRQVTNQKIIRCFCLSETGLKDCPAGTPVFSQPTWEKRGKGDEMMKKVDGKTGSVVAIVKKGEAVTMTGCLLIVIPGEAIIKMYDKQTASKFDLANSPLFFN